MRLRVYIAIAAAVIALIGIVGLFLPVSANVGGGRQADCGSAIAPDAKSAGLKGAGRDIADATQGAFGSDHSTSYELACETALSGRRSWTLPLTGLGVIAIIGALVVAARPVTGPGHAKEAHSRPET